MAQVTPDGTLIISGPADLLEMLGLNVNTDGSDEEILVAGTKNKLTAPPPRVKAHVYASAAKGAKKRTVPPMTLITFVGHGTTAIAGQVVNLPPIHPGTYYGIDLHYVSGPQILLTDAKVERDSLIQYNTKATASGSAAVTSALGLGGTADVGGGPIVYRLLLNPDAPGTGAEMDDAIPCVLTATGGVASGAPSTLFNSRVWKDVPKYGKDVRVVYLNA